MIIRELSNYKNIFNSKILLIHGDNVALKKEYEKKIVKLFNKNNYNSKIYYEEDFFKNKDIVYNLFENSLFEEKEFFIIKNTTDKILQIIKENSHEISKNIILLAPYLKKNSKLRQLIEKHKIYASIVCYEDDENQMINILRSKLNENGIKIENETLQKIIVNKNINRQDINDAIEKITISDVSTENLSEENILNFFNATNSYSNFDIANIILTGEKSKLNKSINENYNNNYKYIEIIPAIRYTINKLLNIRNYNINENDVTKLVNAYKPPIFWKEKNIVITQLRNWKKKELEKLLNDLFNIEIMCKENYNLSSIIFNKFLIDTCAKNKF